MGVTGCLLNGISQGALYVGLALYGSALGLGAGATGFFIVALTLGGIASQFPVGRLSDHADRRTVIVSLAGLAVPVCLATALGAPDTGPGAGPDAGEMIWRYGGVAMLGALVLPVYSLCLAHTNDHLHPGQIVPASGAMVLILGLGIMIGATAGPAAMQRLGPGGLFWFIAAIQILTVATALFRLWRAEVPESTRGNIVPVGHGATAMAAHLNPDAPFRETDVNEDT